MTTDYQCPARHTVRYGEVTGTWRCTQSAGHAAMHVDSRGMRWDDGESAQSGALSTAQVPRRCGQRHTTTTGNPTWPAVTLFCMLAAEHSGAYHRADDGSTWSSADDLQGPPSLQHDASGFPPTAAPQPCGVKSTQADGWHGVCDRPAGHDGGHREMAILDPKGTANLVALLQERGELIAKYRAALAREGTCICPICRETGVPNDLDELCPQHGTVAEMARTLVWASSFTDRIIGALALARGADGVPSDSAGEVVRLIERGSEVDNVNAELTAAGIDYPHGSAGVHDLAQLHEGACEHADNCEKALARIADLARQALNNTRQLPMTPAAVEGARRILDAIIAVTEEKDR